MVNDKKTVRRIAIEEAFVTQEILDAWQRVLSTNDNVDPGFRLLAASVFGDTPGARRMEAGLLDLGEGRIEIMDANGIDMQVLSLTSPGVQVLDPEEATALAAHSNDVLAEAIKRYPGRFAGLTAVAPNAPEQAAREIQRGAQTLGLCGVIINSHTHGRYLDDPFFAPVLEAAQSLGQPIYLHPRDPSPQMVQPMLDYGLFSAIWGFAAETGLHAMRLIFSGTFDRFPQLRIILGHMGEAIPFWLQRIDNRYKLLSSVGALKPLKRLPSEYFLDNFLIATSGVCSAPALRLALEVVGPERIMFAADYPYESVEEAVTFMDDMPISDDVRAAILHGNAERYFGLAPAS